MPSILVCCFFALIPAKARSQEKYIQVGVGTTFGHDSTAYSVDFQFNRTEPEESKTGPWLQVWPVGRTSILGLKPSAAASVGNGTKTAPDNVSVEALLRLEDSAVRATKPYFAFTPIATADKNFETGLLYGRVSTGLVHYGARSVMRRFYLIPQFGADWGSRKTKGRRSDPFLRFTPSIEFRGVYEHFSGGFISKLYAVNGDPALRDGSYGYCAAVVDYRFFARRPKKAKKTQEQDVERKPLVGIATKYTIGREEPLFQKLNALTVGVSLYR